LDSETNGITDADGAIVTTRMTSGYVFEGNRNVEYVTPDANVRGGDIAWWVRADAAMGAARSAVPRTGNNAATSSRPRRILIGPFSRCLAFEQPAEPLIRCRSC
jgi:hypothetical protein